MTIEVKILSTLIECSNKGFRLMGMSFLIVSVATVVSMVNANYCYAHPNHLKEDGFIVTSIDVLNEMHNIHTSNHKVHDVVGATFNNNNGKEDYLYLQQQKQQQDTAIAKITGDQAKKLIDELNLGTMIHFKISTDENGNEVVELSREYS